MRAFQIIKKVMFNAGRMSKTVKNVRYFSDVAVASVPEPTAEVNLCFYSINSIDSR